MNAELNKVLAEGKTKKILSIPRDTDRVIVKSKNDITAGNGARHDVMNGKAELATRTTCNVFNFLRRQGLPLAYHGQSSSTGFIAEKCTMLPYEVVVRAEAHGSALKRDPSLKKGDKFDPLRVEFYLKTAGKKWKNHDLVADDPYMKFAGDKIELYDPAKPLAEPFLVLDSGEVFNHPNEEDLFEDMMALALAAFLYLKKAWALQGRNLVDYKVEFGVNTRGELRLADVIDNDSWRLVHDDTYEDKQGYRDGDNVDDVLVRYKRVADLTDNFPTIAITR